MVRPSASEEEKTRRSKRWANKRFHLTTSCGRSKRTIKMSGDLKKNSLASFFGTKSQNSEEAPTRKTLSDQNNKDMLRDYYAKTNRSLVLKIHKLEVELAKSRKEVEELRNENALLRKRLPENGELDNAENIEALIEARMKASTLNDTPRWGLILYIFSYCWSCLEGEKGPTIMQKRKMDRLGHISTRTIALLHKSASALKNAFEDFGIEVMSETDHVFEEDRGGRRTLSASGEPRLSSVSESPPLIRKSQAVSGYVEDSENSRLMEDLETPTCTQVTRRPRRSELFGRSHVVESQDYDEPSTPLCSKTSSPPKDNATIPVATPTSQHRRPALDTPAATWTETDTVRRKRTATLKIKTLTEPRLNSKLRRPGRNDEPHPFISSGNL